MDAFILNLRRLALLMTLMHAVGGTEKYKSPLLFVKFDGNTKDLTGRNSDAELGSAVSYTTGPYGEENGGVLLDGSINSYVEWTNGDGGPLQFKDEVTLIYWSVFKVKIWFLTYDFKIMQVPFCFADKIINK